MYDLFNLPNDNLIEWAELREQLGPLIYSRPMVTKFGNPDRSGNHVQYIYANGTALVDYGHLIAVYIDDTGRFYFSGYHDWSRTTMWYCGQWSGMSTKERRDMIKTGYAGEILRGF